MNESKGIHDSSWSENTRETRPLHRGLPPVSAPKGTPVELELQVFNLRC